MKILIDVRKLSSKPSGIGIYTFNFIQSILDSEIKIILISDVLESFELNQLKKIGIDVICYGKKVDKNLDVYKYFKYIQKNIFKIKPDIFWEPNNIMPINIKNPFGAVVTTIHDIFPITTPEYYGLIYKLYFRFCINRTINASDAFIYVSEDTKDNVEEVFKKSVKKKKFVSYNIVDVKNNKIKNDDYNYFLYIGNIEKRKGVDLLIESFKLYREEGGEKLLYIAGNIRDNKIKEKIDEINRVDNSIILKGYISSSEKNKLLENCSCFVFPSKAEGFGIPPIEAISFNKPCIVSDINIFKEVLSDGVDYFKIEDENKKSIINLKNKLFNYKKIDEIYRKNIISKYSSANLGVNFLEFITSIVQNGVKNEI
ncbi:glycosyltransferase family 4 protein [Clostridium perfringens]|uniref:glycosyltransferase family 4 protein n=1 Tax=Clostridium perfringens TaxID=1502 RepID=UPI0024BC25E7|nr:glycosyltransferase family 1 protein [Clostridium perfringens]MDK0822921.1 glycosyltransferase family 1 protein [Clostridium perfringens]